MEHIIEEQSKSINKLVKANKQMSDYCKELQAENVSLRSQLAEVTAERDAAVEDLRSKADCTTCKYRAQKPGHGTCNHCGKEYSGWQWSGLRKEMGDANG